ncbi:MAG: hypothetical protein KatS3mg033_1504 [Thermonema sp.]|uniref:carboxypeptidase-like regulatory domain-containing protein n=1 Tax=Thermonema sp. TaxID=2231181 RepID=UPI0021DEC81C|nr:carboxypeptidase-like regulatory domain-containing protein [Thermonema sp.]GIV39704.1 MAG: hypothetical protein KatS3mg033_1504 [Thermonema sp.]
MNLLILFSKKALRLKSLSLCLLLSLWACQAQKNTTQAENEESMGCRFSIKEGIAGQVLWREGNWMPAPNAPERKAQGIEREVYVYELTTDAQTEKNGSFYTAIHSKPVAKTRSDANGCFEIALPPGRYSLFVKEKEGWFANRFDGEGHIQPVEVKAGELSRVDLVVDYKAAY